MSAINSGYRVVVGYLSLPAWVDEYVHRYVSMYVGRYLSS
jgi:hypothetical protein